jgi:hypothetical protein
VIGRCEGMGLVFMQKQADISQRMCAKVTLWQQSVRRTGTRLPKVMSVDHSLPTRQTTVMCDNVMIFAAARASRFRSTCLRATVGLLLWGIVPTGAQVTAPDPDTPQVVGLFQTCMRFTGNASALRDWIASHHLPPVPDSQAAPFLGAAGPGQVFGASTASGKHSLVSYDSGACQVIALSGDLGSVEQMLRTNLSREGVAVTPALERSKPDVGSTQHVFRAEFGQKHWMLSVTSIPHATALNLPPELHLMATIDKGTPTSTQ